MKIENIKSAEELVEFYEKKYKGRKAIPQKNIERATKIHYKKSDGKQYYSSAQAKAVLNGD